MSEGRAAAFTQNIHPNTHEDDFRTPAYLFDWINDLFGPIQFDAACEDGVNNLAPALRLEATWPRHSTIYSNPPFDSDSIVRWFRKGRIHANNGGTHIMCIPNKLCQVFFTEMLPQCDEVWMLGGRVDFSGPYSVAGGASRSGTVIIIQRPRPAFDLCDGDNRPLLRGAKLSTLKARYKLKQEEE